MNRTKKVLTAFLSGALCASMLASSLTGYAVVACGSSQDGYRCHSNQYHTFGDKVMTGGIGQYGKYRRYYWVEGTFDAAYKGYANSAVSEWVNTTGAGTPGVYTSISLRQTTVKKDAMFEIARNDQLGSTTLGRTQFFKYDDPIPLNSNGSLSANYGWARCSINVSKLNQYTAAHRKGTIAHELGHAFGLSHQNCRAASIMCQTGKGRTAVRADKTDLKTINHLYS